MRTPFASSRSLLQGGGAVRRTFASLGSLLQMLAVAVLLVLAPVVQGEATGAGEESPSLAPPSSSWLEGLQSFGESLLGAGEPEFLHPDVAYVLGAEGTGPDTVVVRFDIADAYYLYREKLSFALDESAGVRIAEVSLPVGLDKEDEFFGRMEVYYHEVVATLRLARAVPDPLEVDLTVGYQGCADAGLCYPPMKKTLPLWLPAALAARAESAPPLAPIATAELPEQDRVARSLAGDSLWPVLGAFFGFGLLLTFTPCVFPMVPILASIIAGQGASLTTARAFTLSLAYVLAMAATYTAAGIIAGLTGANLQAAFQAPEVLVAFSAVFVALAAAMFGLYDLELPRAWQAELARASARQRGGTYLGAGIMGLFSALIVGPCVAAPLAGALIYISRTGDAVLGGAALFALGLGMGTPLLVIGGSAGKWLPRAGPWMRSVKAVFGVALLAVAIYLIERIVPGWVSMLLWAALLIMSAIFLGALDSLRTEAGPGQRLLKGVGLLMVVYGVLLMVGAAGGGGNPVQPLKGVSFAGGVGETRALEFRQVKGVEGLERALRLAAAERRPVMLDFYADWCVSCKELERYTFSDAQVRAALAGAVLLQADVTANDALDRALLERFGLFGPPAILFFGPDARERARFRVIGYLSAGAFLEHLSKALG